MCNAVATHCSIGVAVKAKNESLLLDTALVLAITKRASPLYSQNKTGKNSNRNSVRVLAWWGRAAHASEQTLTYSRRSYSTTLLFHRRNTSRNGGEPMSAELDGQYKRLRRPLATAWRTKRSGIIRGRYLSMWVPTSPLANDVQSCREMTQVWAIGESPKGRGEVLFRGHAATP